MVNYVKNADVHRAGDCAMSAAHTKVYAKTFLVVNEFMHRPLPPAAVLCRAGIMATGFQCKINVIARIITLVTDTRVLDLFVGDLEAMAGRTNKSACVAADTVT